MMQSGLVTLIQISGSMHERRSMMTIFYRLMNDFDMENFGAKVGKVDGHKLDEMRDAARTPHRGKPLIILANSSPFRGMPSLQLRFPKLHYVRFKSERERAEMNKDIARSLGVEPIDYQSH